MLFRSVAGSVIISAQLSFPGANMRTTPVFTLSEIPGYTGTGSATGPLVAQMAWSPNVVTSFDSTSPNAPTLSSPRGVFLTTVTAAQILANAWVVIQELGVAPVLVTAGAAVSTPGASITATSATTTSAAAAAPGVGFLGYSLDAVPAVNTIVRVDLALPTRQG